MAGTLPRDADEVVWVDDHTDRRSRCQRRPIRRLDSVDILVVDDEEDSLELAIRASPIEQHRNTPTLNRFNDFPLHDYSPMLRGKRRRLSVVLSLTLHRFLHSSQLHLLVYPSRFVEMRRRAHGRRTCQLC